MKAFYLSDRKSEGYHKRDKKIVDSLTKHGYKIDTTHYKSTVENDEKDLKVTYNKYMQSIKNSELVVAEVSFLSSGLGFFISAALNANKPVLALFNTESNEGVSKTLKGSTDKLMHYVEYDWKSLDQHLVKFTSTIKKKLDSKFILIISPEIDRYLEWSSQENRMHKAQIVRDAIEKVMNKDTEYKRILEIDK
jgi:hypothetical protein